MTKFPKYLIEHDYIIRLVFANVCQAEHLTHRCRNVQKLSASGRSGRNP